MSKRLQVFVTVNEGQKELVRLLAYKLRMSESDIMKAAAMPVLHKLMESVENPEEAKKIRTLLLTRLNGRESK